MSTVNEKLEKLMGHLAHARDKCTEDQQHYQERMFQIAYQMAVELKEELEEGDRMERTCPKCHRELRHPFDCVCGFRWNEMVLRQPEEDSGCSQGLENCHVCGNLKQPLFSERLLKTTLAQNKLLGTQVDELKDRKSALDRLLAVEEAESKRLRKEVSRLMGKLHEISEIVD